MSRVGRLPIVIPDGVSVALEGQRCAVRGSRGELSHEVHADIRVAIDDGSVVVTRTSDAPRQRALHGLTRALIANMVQGVSQGYRRSLEIVGTGYRAELRGETLVLNLGFSHQVALEPLPGVAFEVETPQRVHVDGIDKQAVGQQAALVRRVRPPEPYRGKGVRYLGEFVRIKAGKSVATIG